MSKIGTAYLAATQDDMSSLDLIPEIAAINRMLEGIELPTLSDVEGFEDDCSE